MKLAITTDQNTLQNPALRQLGLLRTLLSFSTTLTLVLCTCLMALNSTLSHAEEADKKARWYKVNLTVFKQKPDSKLDESFSAQTLKLDFADVVRLKQKAEKTAARSAMNAPIALHHEALSAKAPFIEQSIDDSWTELLTKLDPATQPILYNSQWVQPVYDQNNILPLYFETSVRHLDQPQLRGLLHLHVSRYLHANFTINYWPEDADSHEDLISFESGRRMRSKEVHYLDHPLIGILLRILPADNPTERAGNLSARAAGL